MSWEAANDGKSAWVSSTYMDWNPQSWLHPGLALLVAGTWEMKQQMENLISSHIYFLK